MPDSEQLANLKRKLAARERDPAYASNIQELKREIERLEKEQADGDRAD